MAPTASFLSPSQQANPPKTARRARRKTASRWLLSVCAFALMAITTRYVGAAFADLGRVDAQVRALAASVREANAVAGANLGPQWLSLKETPAGQRALVGWFEALDRAWPSLCATQMLAIDQTAAACLPVPETLGPLLDAQIGAGAYAGLTLIRAAPPALAVDEAAEAFSALEAPLPAPPEAALPIAVATPPAAFDDGSAFTPEAPAAAVTDAVETTDARAASATPEPAAEPTTPTVAQDEAA